ncbi:OmpA family protein [Pleurocapsales cyanobacterium LEGE 10410]|nr:OmpA family protein [Pleurocapsales cyanobacterium LEGE 10410]
MSSAENSPSSTKNTDSISSQNQLIDDLVDLLLDPKLSPEPSAEKTPADKLANHSNSSVEIAIADIETTLDEEIVSVESNFDQRSQQANFEELESNIVAQHQAELISSEALDQKDWQQNGAQKARSPQLQVDPIDSVKQSIRQVETSDSQSLEDLVESINGLIPLMVELLKFKLEDSREGVIQTVAPVLDRLIEQRSREDSQKMATAIAKILPFAISEEINLSPEAIAKAIAPEIALSIKEQILLDENAISEALGSEMGKAIKTQIELERDAMVDALYPVIGSTISKYMVEVVREINHKVESTLSPEGFKRKIRAKIQGVSEAELILQESVGYCVQAVFLIQKDSGLIIQEVQRTGEKHLDSDLIAGMLTAIRSFANDCITSGSELDSIDYGDWQIPIETAGYCYLAVVLTGQPSRQFRTKVRLILSKIVLDHGDTIQKYDGNMANVPPELKAELELLTEPEPEKSSSSPTLLWLVVFVLGIIFIPWGIVTYRARIARNIERVAAVQLDAAPELSVYRLEPRVSRGELSVSGRVPSQYLRGQAAEIAQQIADQNNLQLDNQIITVDLPINPTSVTGEIQRLTSLFNQQPEVNIETDYQPRTLTVRGFILNQSLQQNISQAFSKIPGVNRVVINVVARLPTIGQRIYFELGSSQLNFADNSSKINTIEKLLNQYPRLNLNLIAYSDGQGSIKINQRLGRERCQNVKDALVARGIESNRLVTQCESLLIPSDIEQSGRATWLNRYVSFEAFIPTNSN